MFTSPNLELELELSKIYLAEDASDLSTGFDAAINKLAIQLEQGKVSKRYFSAAATMVSLMKIDAAKGLPT